MPHTVSPGNFLRDVDTNGTFTFGDVMLVNANLARGLPAP